MSACSLAVYAHVIYLYCVAGNTFRKKQFILIFSLYKLKGNCKKPQYTVTVVTVHVAYHRPHGWLNSLWQFP